MATMGNVIIRITLVVSVTTLTVASSARAAVFN